MSLNVLAKRTNIAYLVSVARRSNIVVISNWIREAVV